jgi:putative membrane protein
MSPLVHVAPVAAVAGAVGSVLACVPGLHIYNVLGGLAVAVCLPRFQGLALPPEALIPLWMGLVTGYAVANTIPSVLLAAPDESALFTVLPGQKRLMRGRGFEAILITTCGAFAGLLALVTLGWLAPRMVPSAHAVFRAHYHWIVWCVIAFLLMSEWPKGGFAGPAGWRKFAESWRGPGFGLLTFLLSGALGLLLLYGSPIRVESAFQGLMPAFVGLFAVPWLAMNLVTRVRIPPQNTRFAELGGRELARGAIAGVAGGAFAAFFPVVTGGIGGLLAGHSFAVRDDRVFLASQGASKVVYLVGCLLLFFVPGGGLTRGGAAGLLAPIHVAGDPHQYQLALASLAIAGAVALALTPLLSRAVIRLLERCGYRSISALAAVGMVAMVWAVTGWAGLAVMAVAAAIGLVPVLQGSRRLNGLGVILLPIALNMSGKGAAVAAWFGLG